MPHANARLTVHGRRLLVERVRFDGRPVSHVAKEMGISRQCAHRWVKRYDQLGWAGLCDRSSRPHRVANRTGPVVEAQVVRMREDKRCGRDEISRSLGVPARTVSRILHRYAVPPLDPITGEVIRASRSTSLRYERDHPGDLLHVDVKKLGRIPPGGGWRLHRRGKVPFHHAKVGFDYVHAAVDDHTRLAYAEILPDEKGPTSAGFLTRAAAWFAEHGIQIHEVMTDNAWSYRYSLDFQAAVSQISARHLLIKPHCPWQNGKVERLNRTLQAEWAYRQPFTSNAERAEALDPWLQHYNTERYHHSIGGPPISRLS